MAAGVLAEYGLRTLHVAHDDRRRRQQLAAHRAVGGGHSAAEAAVVDKVVVGGDGQLQIGTEVASMITALVEEERLERRARLPRVALAARDEVGTADLAMRDAAAERAASGVEEEYGSCRPGGIKDSPKSAAVR